MSDLFDEEAGAAVAAAVSAAPFSGKQEKKESIMWLPGQKIRKR